CFLSRFFLLFFPTRRSSDLVFSVVFPSFFSCFSFSSSCTFFERTYCRYPLVTCLTASSFSKPAPIAPATVAADVTSLANFSLSCNFTLCHTTSLLLHPHNIKLHY